MPSIERRTGSHFSPRLIFGILLIVVGVIYTAGELFEGFEPDSLLQFWPLLLVAAGLSKLLAPGTGSGRFTGFLMVMVGLVLQLNVLDYVQINLWPLVLVAVGLRLAWHGVFGRAEKPSANEVSSVDALAFMGGTTRTSSSPDFQGGDLLAIMGGCEVDLRQANILHGPAVIDAFALWGGVEIKVPKDWSVTVKGIPVIGAYEDSTEPPAVDTGQHLVIKGFAIMGGIEVTN